MTTSAVARIACSHCKATDHKSEDCQWPALANLGPVEFAKRIVPQLTPRQREVLRWIASDLSADSIATVMGLSVHTVLFYRKQVYRRLGVGSAVAATAVAFRAGLVQ